MSLPGAADDAAPTLRNKHGLYAVRKEAIGKTAIHAGHSKPDRFVALKFKQRSQFRKAECQTALNIDPGSASNFDPLDEYGGTPLINPAKRVGVAQPV